MKAAVSDMYMSEAGPDNARASKVCCFGAFWNRGSGVRASKGATAIWHDMHIQQRLMSYKHEVKHACTLTRMITTVVFRAGALLHYSVCSTRALCRAQCAMNT